MKKKRINIVLIIGVALIWGLLIYRFLGNSFTSQENQKGSVAIAYDELPTLIQKDTIELKLYTKDPFLGTLKNTRKLVSKTKKGATIKKIKSVLAVQWPQLQYLGFVKEVKAREPLLLLKVNGKLMRKKSSFEFYEGMKILNFNRDSLLIKFNGTEKTLNKL